MFRKILVVSMSAVVSISLAIIPTTAKASQTYTIKVSLEVKSKYPGTDAPSNVLTGCKEGFPLDSDFTSAAQWEIYGSQNDLIGTADVGKISVKDIQRVLPPFYNAQNGSESEPYIFGGTCIYTGVIKVPKSNAYKIRFGGIGLRAISFIELNSRKWKIALAVDLNCGSLYSKACK